jgi:hypothetical protein
MAIPYVIGNLGYSQQLQTIINSLSFLGQYITGTPTPAVALLPTQEQFSATIVCIDHACLTLSFPAPCF